MLKACHRPKWKVSQEVLATVAGCATCSYRTQLNAVYEHDRLAKLEQFLCRYK